MTALLPMSEQAIRQLLDGTTSGPWKADVSAERHDDDASVLYFDVSICGPVDPDHLVAFWQYDATDDGFHYNGQVEADVALLAASPDLAATALALHADKERLLSGDYCEHGLDCPGTGPECARMGTVEEARQRAWDAGVLLSNAEHAEQATTIATLEGIVKRYQGGWTAREQEVLGLCWWHPRMPIDINAEPMTPAERVILTGEAEHG